MLHFTLKQETLIDGNSVETLVQVNKIDLVKQMPKTEKSLEKLLTKLLKENDIENENGDIPSFNIKKDEVVVTLDVYNETNDDGEDVTVQEILTIKKVKNEVVKYIDKYLDDITKEHLQIWSSRYANYKCAELKYDLNVNHDFSADIEAMLNTLELPEDFELDSKLEQLYTNKFVKLCVKNFKR